MTPAQASYAPASRPELSIIIVSFNTREITRNCLQSLRVAQLQIQTEVIVVDNASSDHSPEMIAEEFPEVILIRNEKNLMFSKANNQGMSIARGDFFFLLNSDTLVESGNIEKLFAFLKQHAPRVGCVGPRVLRADGTVQSEGEAFDSYRYVLSRFFFLDKLPLPCFLRNWILPLGFHTSQPKRPRKVGFVVGCSFMFPREVFQNIGGLDEDFVFYGEELEFCFRLWKTGYEVWVLPEAVITHLGGSSWTAGKHLDQTQRPKIPDYFERRFLLHRKTFGVKHRIGTNRLRILLYSAILPAVWLLSRSKAAQLREKIRFHREENMEFIRMLTASGI